VGDRADVNGEFLMVLCPLYDGIAFFEMTLRCTSNSGQLVLTMLNFSWMVPTKWYAISICFLGAITQQIVIWLLFFDACSPKFEYALYHDNSHVPMTAIANLFTFFRCGYCQAGYDVSIAEGPHKAHSLVTSVSVSISKAFAAQDGFAVVQCFAVL